MAKIHNLYDSKPQNAQKYHLHSANHKRTKNVNFKVGTVKGPECAIHIKPTPKEPKYTSYMVPN